MGDNNNGSAGFVKIGQLPPTSPISLSTQPEHEKKKIEDILKQKEKELKETKEELMKKEEELKEKKREIEKNEQALKKDKEKIQALEEKLKQSEEEIQILKKELDEKDEEIQNAFKEAALQFYINHLKQKEIHQTETTVKNKEIEELKKQKEEANKEHKELQHKNNELQNIYDELQIKYNELQTKYDEMQGKYNEIQSKYENLEIDNIKIREELKEIKDSISSSVANTNSELSIFAYISDLAKAYLRYILMPQLDEIWKKDLDQQKKEYLDIARKEYFRQNAFNRNREKVNDKWMDYQADFEYDWPTIMNDKDDQLTDKVKNKYNDSNWDYFSSNYRDDDFAYEQAKQLNNVDLEIIFHFNDLRNTHVHPTVPNKISINNTIQKIKETEKELETMELYPEEYYTDDYPEHLIRKQFINLKNNVIGALSGFKAPPKNFFKQK